VIERGPRRAATFGPSSVIAMNASASGRFTIPACSGDSPRPDWSSSATRAQGAPARPPRRKPATAAELKNDVSLVTFLRNAVEAASDDDGWAPLAGVGNIITNQRPDFDPRSYGYGKLSDLITATTLFETDRRSPGDGKQPIIYARLKRRRSPAKRVTAAAKAVAPLKA
jgi:OST-HTH/LOTUS domain